MSFAFVFPGQGSQSVGMMAAYGESEVIRATFAEASAALGEDLWAMAAEGPAERLSLTVNTQPLMLTAGVAVWRAWRAAGGATPTVVAGHSLGEYSALVAAGALELADAVRLVRLRAQAMQDAVPAGTGGMAAILGLSPELVAEACAEAAQGEEVAAANLNDPGQIVIAGHAGAVARACEAAKARGAKRALPLPVSAPFHSALMRPAAERLALALQTVDVRTPAIRVVNNVDVAIESDPVRIKDALVRQAYSPVRWIETVQALAAHGVTQVVECGPGKVLMGLVKRCGAGPEALAISDADTLAKILEVTKGAAA
ncbi:ACP S-malonyltransferase [Niveibacterium microcysteis]|uniref:Malonyl CoA-acyl carrier protein transacylase n=1 Tax=Niveibacterium microcysteis TaxID=2811415 RepID=A0ABX7M1X8_9RHOO|nr:ACP S-malonyltransferase [Niveibacterium microcysteis]QSI75772.1 ACP S-malonyltransferase [Niveibacterium microcysteis]